MTATPSLAQRAAAGCGSRDGPRPRLQLVEADPRLPLGEVGAHADQDVVEHAHADGSPRLCPATAGRSSARQGNRWRTLRRAPASVGRGSGSEGRPTAGCAAPRRPRARRAARTELQAGATIGAGLAPPPADAASAPTHASSRRRRAPSRTLRLAPRRRRREPARARRAATRSPGRTGRSARGTGRSGSGPARSGRPARRTPWRRAARPAAPRGASARRGPSGARWRGKALTAGAAQLPSPAATTTISRM